MSNISFLCRSCSSVICPDCKAIAEEYPELLEIRNQELLILGRRIEDLSRDLASAKRRSDGFEEIAKLGLPEVIRRWIDSQMEEKRPAPETRLRKAARQVLEFKIAILQKEFDPSSPTLKKIFRDLEEAVFDLPEGEGRSHE